MPTAWSRTWLSSTAAAAAAVVVVVVVLVVVVSSTVCVGRRGSDVDRFEELTLTLAKLYLLFVTHATQQRSHASCLVARARLALHIVGGRERAERTWVVVRHRRTTGCLAARQFGRRGSCS